MPISYYLGIDGPTIVIKTVDDLKEAIGILHTQAVDAELPDDALAVLEDAIEKLAYQ